MIELIDFAIASDGSGKGLWGLNLSLHIGNVYAIDTDSSIDPSVFLQALATLLYPVYGIYRFRGESLDFSDYRTLLPVKKKIGYIGSHAAMISNLSIRENLLLMRYYSENSLKLTIDGVAAALCNEFGLNDYLDMRPGALTLSALRLAITARELAKEPYLLLLEYPEEYIGHTHLDTLSKTLADMPLFQMIIVFMSNDQEFVERFATKHISIINGNFVMDSH